MTTHFLQAMTGFSNRKSGWFRVLLGAINKQILQEMDRTRAKNNSQTFALSVPMRKCSSSAL